MSEIDLNTPRTIGEIVDVAVVGHRRHPILFFSLTLSVVLPFTLIVWAATGATQLTDSHVSTRTTLLVAVIGLALVGPLISVLHVHALAMLGDGHRPTFAGVYRAALRVLPVAAAAQIVAGIGIFAGLFVFVIPGLLLLARLAVAAQVAAIERTDWVGALRRSAEMTFGNGWHTFGAVAVAAAFELALAGAASAAAGNHTHAPQIVLAVFVALLAQSFTAIVGAFLYFDLRSRAGS